MLNNILKMKFSKNSCYLWRRFLKSHPPTLNRFSHASSIQSQQGKERTPRVVNCLRWTQDRYFAAVASPNFDFRGQWPENDQKQFLKDMRVLENFLSADEEEEFLKEIEPYLKRMRYEFDHWDDVSYYDLHNSQNTNDCHFITGHPRISRM
jgi:hypothetical protein